MVKVRKPLTQDQKDRKNKRRRENYWNSESSLRHYNNEYLRNNPEQALWQGAKQRAQESGLEFSISRSDILIPLICPYLEIPLIKGRGRPLPNSPSLDRINSNKGYTKDNIIVCSHRANTIKNSSSIEEFEMILKNWKILLG